MASDSSPTASLLQALETLSEDQRLARVFGKARSSACSVHLWLLELTQAQTTTTEYRILFGWVIPATFQKPDKWNLLDGGKKKNWGTQENPYKFRIAKLTLYHDNNVIFNLIKGLCQGLSLDESCNKIDVVCPKKPYGQLRLAGSPEQLAKSFAIRPTVFLETPEINRDIFKELQPLASPIDNVSANACALWRLNKLSLFSKNTKELLPQADDLVKECLSHLTEETGLNFRGTGSKRLGNVEWLCFPAADEKENSQVKISTDSFARDLEIEILPGFLESGTQVLVRCRLRNEREVILDQCKIAQITQTATRVNFKANQEISKVLVTIWVRQNHEDSWEIWYEHSPFVLRALNVSLGAASFQGSLPSDWLQEFINSRVRERVERVQAVRQVSYETLEIGKDESSPWIAANRQIHRLTQRLFPEPSGGGFFSKGWDANAEEPGRLSFFEWLKSLTSNSTASKILIVDPYFDTSGIVELVARAEAVQAEYVVLTNTQVKSDDDSLETESGEAQAVNELEEPLRATRLREACKQVELLLTNLKFRLLDLRSKQGGRTQLFHDRYVLVFDELGEVEAGYHLSNSIQGATKRYPLLITPIPKDLLTAVKDYVGSLLALPDDSPTELITLFFSVNRPETSFSEKEQHRLATIPHSNFFFASLLHDEKLSSLNQVELSSHLQSFGLLTKEDSTFAVTDQIDSYLNSFTQKLLISNTVDFAELWAAFGSWLACLPDADEYLNKVITGGGQNLVLKIQQFLFDAPEQKLPIGSLGAGQNADSIRIIDLILRDFKKGLREDGYLLKIADWHSWRYYSPAWGIRYGGQALAELYPEQLVTVVSEMWHTLIAEIRTNGNTPNVWAIADTLTSIIKPILNQVVQIQLLGVTDSGLLPALLRSDVPLLRAIGAQSLSPLWNEQAKLQDAFAAIDTLQEIERVQALAEWVFELRIRANVNNHEDADLRKLRLAIFAQMRQAWPAKLPPDEFRDIVHRLSGPAEGGWAVSTTNDLLRPLVKDNKLTLEEIAELWLPILFERLKAHVFVADNQQLNESSHVDFSAPADWELTEVCGWILANIPSKSQTNWLKKLEEIKGYGQRVLYRPFSRSHNYSTWRRAGNCLLWLQILVNIIRSYAVEGIISNTQKIEDLKKLDNQLNNALIGTHEANNSPSTGLLLEFLANVKQKIEEQLNSSS